jgi:hypothetical protein
VTDARFPERWLNDRRILRLTDPAFRVFVTALAWSVSNRTDGVLDDTDLQLLPHLGPSFVDELEKAGLWRRECDRWLITDYAATQTTRDHLDQLEKIRRVEREKKARQRANARKPKPPKSAGQSPGRSDGTVPGDCTGQERPGEERSQERQVSPESSSGVCVECGNPEGLLAAPDDGQLRCRKHHFRPARAVS